MSELSVNKSAGVYTQYSKINKNVVSLDTKEQNPKSIESDKMTVSVKKGAIPTGSATALAGLGKSLALSVPITIVHARTQHPGVLNTVAAGASGVVIGAVAGASVAHSTKKPLEGAVKGAILSAELVAFPALGIALSSPKSALLTAAISVGVGAMSGMAGVALLTDKKVK